MNVSIFSKTDYEKKQNWTLGQNKPNSNPIKPNSRKAQMNVNSLITKDYIKYDDFAVRKNKPNSNPISSKPKMSANALSQKDYENETAFRLQKNKAKTNPISNATTVFLPITQEIATCVWQNISEIKKGLVRICIPANGYTGFPWKPGHQKIKVSGQITYYPGILLT
ncbi:MAG: hypothetical protein ACETWQ_08115 [Phycisphaerae bacterium]